jgi:hypothetical protein
MVKTGEVSCVGTGEYSQTRNWSRSKKGMNHDIEGSQLLTCSPIVIEFPWVKAVLFSMLDHDLPQKVQERQQSRQRQK